jgi:hypothetical protein
MFAVGVDEMDWDDLDECSYEWPTRAQLAEYRRQVRAMVLAWINEHHQDGARVTWGDPSWIVMMGI